MYLLLLRNHNATMLASMAAYLQGFDAAFTNGVASAQPDPPPAATESAMQQTVKVRDSITQS